GLLVGRFQLHQVDGERLGHEVVDHHQPTAHVDEHVALAHALREYAAVVRIHACLLVSCASLSTRTAVVQGFGPELGEPVPGISSAYRAAASGAVQGGAERSGRTAIDEGGSR